MSNFKFSLGDVVAINQEEAEKWFCPDAEGAVVYIDTKNPKTALPYLVYTKNGYFWISEKALIKQPLPFELEYL